MRENSSPSDHRLPQGWQLPLFLVTGIASGMAAPFCILLGPYSAYLLILTVPLFLWTARRWSQPCWTALAASVAGSALAVALSHRTPYEACITALIAFTVGGYASFTFANTVNGIGESRRLPCTPEIEMAAQQRGYRRRALNIHILHYGVRKYAHSIVLADMDRPPRTADEWSSALAIARALDKRTVRRLRRSWNALVATGRPLHTIAAVIAQTDQQTAVRFLASDIPDEYLTETV